MVKKAVKRWYDRERDYIEEYSAARMRELMNADKISRALYEQVLKDPPDRSTRRPLGPQ